MKMSDRTKVLIVDDRMENLLALRHVLGDLDIELIEALSGNDALTATIVHDFALAILDVQMPEMDGYELAELLRGDPKTEQLPIIFMTAAYGEETQIFRGYNAGAVDYIVKPYSPEILLAKVRVFLELYRTQRALAQKIHDLAASEERYRTLVTTLPDIVYRIDAEGRFTFLNDAVRALGFTPEELIGRPFTEIVHAEDILKVSRDSLLRQYAGKHIEEEGASGSTDERRTGHGKPPGLEVRIVSRKDDQTMYAEIVSSGDRLLVAEVKSSGLYASVEGRSAVFLGTVGVIRDITQRRKDEMELASYHQHLEDMVRERTAQLEKRAREMECLYAISRLVTEPWTSVDDVLQAAVGLIMPGLRHPESACARITFQDRTFTTPNFRESPWRFSVEVQVSGSNPSVHTLEAGTQPDRESVLHVEVLYPEAGTDWVESPFLEEERQLIRNIAGQLGVVIARRQAEVALGRLMAAIEQTGEMVVITDRGGTIQYVNPAFSSVTGFTREEAIGRNPRILKSGKQDETFYHDLWQTISGGRTWIGRMVNKRKDGELFIEDATISPVRDMSGGVVAYVAVKRDVTEHLSLSEQLEQAQKMESVGRLAGGVAHDYNNMLGIILGYAELALYEAPTGTPIHNELTEIRKAAQRSADLTRQLLAFARRQTVDPQVLNLNRAVDGMLKMLRRLIGEDIDLVWLPGTDLWRVKIDPAQIDQILANLCVNARDAITGVGQVTIETQNVTFDHAYCAAHLGFAPGEYVMLAVSDNGCGMDDATRKQIFEPFFTTKEVGRGTGLGLSTVYGIVRQNNGFINVYSEPGQGTTLRIYIPRSRVDMETAAAERAEELPRGKGEAILVVEDEPGILQMAVGILERLGYTVVSAPSPGEAVSLFEEYGGKIDLLLTDVVMPEMNGRELAQRLLAQKPDMKCLFMSGYTANVIVHHGVLEKGVHFTQKPFSVRDLARKVRKILDS